MRTIPLGKTGLNVPAVALGCMRLSALDERGADAYVKTALDFGANFFDHADIYGGGVCEEIFGRAVQGIARDKLLIQSKCGIVPGQRYDFSKEHILRSVEASLKRLQTDYLDVLLLHRPDALMEPEEVAEAFCQLQAAGKVRFFGVSNQNPMQMALLQKYLPMPLCADQIQLSLAFCGAIAQGMHVNIECDSAVVRDGSVLDYCRLNDITIQPWSPFQHGMFGGPFLGSADYRKLNAAIDKVAEGYGVSNTTIALAWLLRHPARFQPVVGTMNLTRLADCLRAADIVLTRQEWYDLYLAAGNDLP